MPDELRIELLPEGWRLEHTAWGGDTVLLRREDGIFVHEPASRPEVMVTPSALVLSGEIRA